MPCYGKDDRVMLPLYRLFHPNFVHAYGHYLRGYDRIQRIAAMLIFNVANNCGQL